MKYLMLGVFFCILSSCSTFGTGENRILYYGGGLYEFNTKDLRTISIFCIKGKARFFTFHKISNNAAINRRLVKFHESKDGLNHFYEAEKILGPSFDIEKENIEFKIIRLKPEKSFENLIGVLPMYYMMLPVRNIVS